MKASSSASKIQMTSLDELLGATTMPDKAQEIGAKVVRIPLKLMHAYARHPFRVLQDAKMAETVESVKRYGVLLPGILRPHKEIEGEYEIIAGHRRHCASELAGLEDMPVIIMDLSDDEAEVIMVDSNIQREDLLPSEKAKAYRMKYDALKRMGAEEGIRNDQILAKQAGESRNTIQRYIRLTYLIEELLQMVDEGKMPRNTAVDISYLRKNEQRKLLTIIMQHKCIPSGKQASKMKELSKLGELSTEQIQQMLLGNALEDVYKFSLKDKEIRKYFPEEYTAKQMEETIIMLLEEWKETNNHKL